MPEYFLISANDAKEIPQELIMNASTEDLFLFLYRVKNARGEYAKAA